MRRKPPGWVVLVPVLWVLGCVAILLMTGVVFGAAQAQQPQQAQCGNHAEILAAIKSQYQEVPVGIGAGASGAAVELTKSPEGSWSIFVVFPNGKACMVASGDGWESISPPEPGTPL